MIGTRPEAIKLAPVAQALAERGLPSTLVFTGQHPGLEPDEFELVGFPAERLDCAGEEDPHRHVGTVTFALLRRFASPPDLIVVQGDTSSALGAALAAFSAGVAVAHVEAGLRTHDPQLPWPEEEYRTAIDAQADLLFAPTPFAAANLRAEGVPGEIHVTGNTSIDAVLAVEADLPPARRQGGGLPQLLVTAHRRESWDEGLHAIATVLRELASEAIIDFVLHPNAYVAATMRELLGGKENIRLLEPCSHRELIQRMRAADLILSDSGGMQEEAPALGIPLLILRDRTERPEAIASGNMLLVGRDPDLIENTVARLLDDPAILSAMRRPSYPYGDGRASQRIADEIVSWLRRGVRPAEPRSPSLRSTTVPVAQ